MSRRWFQLVESRWTDRLMVFRFQQSLATQPGVFNVCCPAHLRELVVHWMTTGRLDFPFARSLSPAGFLLRRAAKKMPANLEGLRSHSGFLGELAIHRESLTRILRENPHALSPVLEALIHTIESDDPTGPYVHPIDSSATSKPLLV